jgi:hypothetical protein
MMKTWMHATHLRNDKKILDMFLRGLLLPWNILMMTLCEHFLEPSSSHCLRLAPMEILSWMIIVLIIDIMTTLLLIV